MKSNVNHSPPISALGIEIGDDHNPFKSSFERVAFDKKNPRTVLLNSGYLTAFEYVMENTRNADGQYRVFFSQNWSGDKTTSSLRLAVNDCIHISLHVRRIVMDAQNDQIVRRRKGKNDYRVSSLKVIPKQKGQAKCPDIELTAREKLIRIVTKFSGPAVGQKLDNLLRAADAIHRPDGSGIQQIIPLPGQLKEAGE